MAKPNRLRVPVPRRVEQILDAALDKAISIERPVVVAYLDRVRKDPGMTPAQLVTRLERQYLTTVIGIGGASGAISALPAVGTGTVMLSSAAEITAFVSASSMFVLALAELHGLPVSDPELRRALVLSVLAGEGAQAVVGGMERGERHWAHVFARPATFDKDRLAGINGYFGKLLIRRMGASQGALLLGRAVPLGIGAAIGAGGNAALARVAISASRKAFGAAPNTFPPRVIDG